jgi:hypothetical protein
MLKGSLALVLLSPNSSLQRAGIHKVPAAVFSWRLAAHANHLGRIKALIALRRHYFDMFRLEVEFVERNRNRPGAIRAAAESAAAVADRMRQIDARLAAHHESLMHVTKR